MGALHNDNGTYYSTTATNSASVLSGGAPGQKWGWVAGAGLRLNFPMLGGGDYLQTQVNYTEGALRYIFFTPNTNYGMVNGASEAFGVMTDCVYGGVVGSSTTGCDQTTAWGVNAAYEHHWGWAPAWQTSAYGGYAAVSYGSQANAMLCQAGGFGASGSGVGSLSVAGAGCDMDWSTWWVGSRTQWNVSKTFYMGVDVLYSDMNGASTGGTCSGSGSCLGSSPPVALSMLRTMRAHGQFASALIRTSCPDHLIKA